MPASPLSLLANPNQNGPVGADAVEVRGAQLGGACRITSTAEARLPHLSEHELARVRYAIWKNNQQGSVPRVDYNYLERASQARGPSFEQAAIDMLGAIHRRSSRLGGLVRLYDSQQRDRAEQELCTIGCINTKQENDDINNGTAKHQVQFYIDYLHAQGYLRKTVADGGFSSVGLTPAGIIYLEKLQTKIAESQQAFVAMWFGAPMGQVWQDGFDPGIRGAGYSPMRIDQHTHQNRIDDEIIAQIRRSRFLVSDFTTGHVTTSSGGTELVPRGGVYFEAGFALGLGIPVIWTIRGDQINGLHFDTRQYPHILWNDAADLRTQLHARIVALIGQGPLPAV
ncbi:hypothetical protein [Methylobacterium sp. PvR107]|uniref:hypothetical protein n=1 Tax=Methylobacterium sp. PvR107 TaxID=2806597 RepID=UPI001AE6D114|nr:hypothetical protein [Methylobacterium sp. PvR107]MBP1179991.1 hypothetical protein [Methylobacterium sp. PvR107]